MSLKTSGRVAYPRNYGAVADRIGRGSYDDNVIPDDFVQVDTEIPQEIGAEDYRDETLTYVVPAGGGTQTFTITETIKLSYAFFNVSAGCVGDFYINEHFIISLNNASADLTADFQDKMLRAGDVVKMTGTAASTNSFRYKGFKAIV